MLLLLLCSILDVQSPYTPLILPQCRDHCAICPIHRVHGDRPGSSGADSAATAGAAATLQSAALCSTALPAFVVPPCLPLQSQQVVFNVCLLRCCFAQGEQLDIRIKWPNDVYASGQKIAGVLTHSTYRSKVFRITVGCGINLANSEPSTCIDDLLRQQVPAARPLNKEVGSDASC